jgi:hypothetical protein
MDHPYLSEFDVELIRVLSTHLVFVTRKIVSQLFPDRSDRNLQFRIRRLVRLGFLSPRLFPAFYPVPKLPLYFAGPCAPEALSVSSQDPAFIAHRKRALYMKDSAIPHFLLIQTAQAKFIAETRQPDSPQFLTWVPSYHPLWETLHDYGFPLNPDGYAELRIDGSIHPMFLELDTGTERRANLKAKFKAYDDYAVSGKFQHHFSTPKFRVLFLTTTPRRISSLLPTVAPFTSHLFWFATIEDFLNTRLLDSYWTVPPSDTPQSLTAPP